MIGINIHTVLIDINDKKETGEGFFNIQIFKYTLFYKVSDSEDDSSYDPNNDGWDSDY